MISLRCFAQCSCAVPLLSTKSQHFRIQAGRSASWQLRAASSTAASRESSSNEGINVAGAKSAILEAQAVCFDVDSTVCCEEGIDVLAEFCGAAKEVADLTNRAMGGSMLFQEALKARLDLMKPSKAIIAKCLIESPFKLSPSLQEFVSALHARGTHVYLVSGGFRVMIDPVADALGIPKSRIYANTIKFRPDGSYAGFDDAEPTSRDGGKPAVVKALKKAHGYSPIVMIGDGATDMQARPPADAFIGYGGVVVREGVRTGADWFIKDFKDLIQIVK